MDDTIHLGRIQRQWLSSFLRLQVT